MRKLREFFQRKDRKQKDKADAVLTTVIISIPLLCLCFAFATGISMAGWQKTAYISAAQSAATASLQAVESNGYLGQPTINAFVNEYLSQTGRTSGLKQAQQNAGTGALTNSTATGQGLGRTETSPFNDAACSTAVINGVERELPYIEVELDINRGAGESTISTYPYTNEGDTVNVKNPSGGHGTVVSGQQYRVINAKVWEASRNITWFGVTSAFSSTAKDMTCQPYNVDVSAILFGNNEDLSAGQQCFQPDMFPVNPAQVKQINTNMTALYESPLTTCNTVVDSLKQNSIVTVTGTYRNWSYVKTPDGKEGWVPTSRLEDPATWTISYDMGCDSYGCGATTEPLPTSYSWKNGTDPIVLADPSKQYYNYGGWQQYNCTTKDPIGTARAPMSIAFGSYGNLCFKAIFAIKQFTVTWDAQGGVGGVPAQQYAYGSTVTVPANATKVGYDSKGWYTDPNAGTKVTGTITVRDSNVIYYQQYNKVNSSITIDPNGGTGGNASPKTYQISSSAQTITLTPPTRPGWSFSYWTVSAGTASVSGNTLTIPANTFSNVTVKAVWIAFPATITVDSNGGSGGAANPTSYTIDTANKTVTLTQPSRTYYTFGGWSFVTQSQGGNSTISGNTLTIPAGAYGPIKIQANWNPQTFNIRYECNGRGWCPPGGPTSYSYGVPIDIPNVSGPNESFNGWTVNQNSRNDLRSGTGVLPAGTAGDVTLYAHWAWTATYYYDPGGSWAGQCSVGGSSYYGCSGWAGCTSGGWVVDYGWVYFTMDNKGRGGDGGGGFGRQVSPVTMGGNSGNGLYYTVRANVTDWPTCAYNYTAYS